MKQLSFFLAVSACVFLVACSSEKYPAFSDSKYLGDFATYSNSMYYIKDTLHIKKMGDCYSVSGTAFYVDKGHLTNGVTHIVVMEENGEYIACRRSPDGNGFNYKKIKTQ
jgi:hypothetical protein